MLEVIAALLPVIAAAVFYFGLAALLVIVASCAGAVGSEWLMGTDRKGWGSLRDYSALLTGILLGLTLPPSIPLWMAFLGGVIAIGLGKLIWGGLGKNLFNPALVGRAFLQASFPTAITTWTPYREPAEAMIDLPASTLAAPLMSGGADVVTTATPLGLAKFEHLPTELSRLLMGSTAGSLGETAGIVLIGCGLWLGFRKVFDWRLPVSTLISVAVFSGALWLVDKGAYPDPLFMLCSGGLLFGAVFMVTDPVTTPITPRGAWIYGIGVGLLVVLIRLFGGLPEGVMYAILLMNSVTPLIERFTQPRPFGG
jgi:electron transport complex protein RnfD